MTKAQKAAKPQEPTKEARREMAINVARETMLGDIRDTVLNKVLKDKKLTGKAWPDMSEEEQKNVMYSVTEAIREAIVRSIDIIQSDGEKHIKAILKQVTMKDGIKAVVECSKHDELRHELIDAQGDTVLIVITGSDRYLGEKEKVKFDKDQRPLPIKDFDEDGVVIEDEEETEIEENEEEQQEQFEDGAIEREAKGYT